MIIHNQPFEPVETYEKALQLVKKICDTNTMDNTVMKNTVKHLRNRIEFIKKYNHDTTNIDTTTT